MAAPKKNATLFTGPPMSKAIMAPRTVARMTLFPVLIVSSQPDRNVMTSSIGMPTTLYMTSPTTNEETTGMTRIGMTGRR